MDNATTTSLCPVPFLVEEAFPPTGGCTCPERAEPCSQNWVYDDRLLNNLQIPGWISIASLIPCVFLLMTAVVLPAEKSQRHYLSVGLIICLVLVQLAFIIPLGTKPQLCFNEITPHDLHTSLSCGWTGALYQAGALGAAFWIALRTLWLHVRVCWDHSPGRYFRYGGIGAGVAVPAVFLVAASLAWGYSFRLGATCVVSHEHGFAVFWGWPLAFAVFAFLMHSVTTAYCVLVYLKHWRVERGRNAARAAAAAAAALEPTAAATEAGTASAGASKPATQSRVRVRNLQQLIFMQWRSFAISVLVVIQSAVLVIVFWTQDKRVGAISASAQTDPRVRAWSLCLTANKGDKNKCLDLVSGLVTSPATVLAGFVMASLLGLEIFLIVVRRSMLTGWWEVLYKPVAWARNRRSSLPFTSLEPTMGRSVFGKASSLRPSTLFRPRSAPALEKSNGRAASGLLSAGGWAHLDAAEPGTRQRPPNRGSRSFKPHRRGRPAVGGVDALALDALLEPQMAHVRDDGDAGSGVFKSPPSNAASAARRTIVRDGNDRWSVMRIETQDEALRRLRGLSAMGFGVAGDRDSMVLGEETWPSEGSAAAAGGESDEDERGGALGVLGVLDKGKGKEKRTSRFEERKGSWMGEGWDADVTGSEDKTRQGSETLGGGALQNLAPGPSNSNRRASFGRKLANPLRLHALGKTKLADMMDSGSESPRPRSIMFADDKERADAKSRDVIKPLAFPDDEETLDLNPRRASKTGSVGSSGGTSLVDVVDLNEILDAGPKKEKSEEEEEEHVDKDGQFEDVRL